MPCILCTLYTQDVGDCAGCAEFRIMQSILLLSLRNLSDLSFPNRVHDQNGETAESFSSDPQNFFECVDICAQNVICLPHWVSESLRRWSEKRSLSGMINWL
jgi:hypothetical protein